MKILFCSLAITLFLGLAPMSKCSEIPPNSMIEFEKPIASNDGRVTLCFQKDGNLVLQRGDKVLWSSGTQGTQNPTCKMQNDGNLVIYTRVNDKLRAVWSSKTVGCEGAILTCQNDGNLVIYHFGNPVWSSGIQDQKNEVTERGYVDVAASMKINFGVVQLKFQATIRDADVLARQAAIQAYEWTSRQARLAKNAVIGVD